LRSLTRLEWVYQRLRPYLAHTQPAQWTNAQVRAL
jgi:hypothetical protein